MSEEELFCPILSISSSYKPCMKKECAFYYIEKSNYTLDGTIISEQCAILAIAKHLNDHDFYLYFVPVGS